MRLIDDEIEAEAERIAYRSLLRSLREATQEAIAHTARLRARLKYSPDQPRDDHGRWTEEGDGGYSVSIPARMQIGIKKPDDSVETRTGGSRSWRNNNPGNIVGGSFANAHGAIGIDAGGMAIFPDYDTGNAASQALLQTPSYVDSTVNEAIARRSPASENDTQQTQANVCRIGGFTGQEVIGNMNPVQLSNLVHAIQQSEGWRVGTVTGK